MKPLNHRSLSQTLWSIATLYDVEGIHPYKARSLRQAATSLREHPVEISGTDPDSLASLPGVGPFTGRVIADILQSGVQKAVSNLNLSIPASILELLHLRGIGPVTARQLYQEFKIASLADLEQSLASGRLAGVSGFKTKRVEQLRREIAALKRHQRTIPIALASPLSAHLVQLLGELPGVSRMEVSGECRRFVHECTQLEFVVNAKDPSALLDWASVRQSASNEASTIDNRTQTLDCTVEIEDKKVPLRFHLAEAHDFPYRLMETTGDATHQQIVEAMAKERGLHWTKGRLFDAMGQPVQCETEAQIYEVLGLPYFPPELREGQGLLIDPEELVDANDIRGDLHTHSSWSDGTLPIRTMALAAQARGYEYIAVTDHSQSLAIAGGLTAEDLLRQREEIERLNDELSGIKILHGIEVDILGDGTLDMPDEVLWELDLVIASVHSAMNQSPKRMTERILKAIEHPAVDIIGHLSGRLIGRREAYGLDFSAVLETAKQSRVCLELNANPNRLDIPDSWLRLAGEAGLLVPINTDAHSAQEYDNIRFGLRMAKRGWLHRQRVLNALPLNELTSLLHRKRKRQ